MKFLNEQHLNFYLPYFTLMLHKYCLNFQFYHFPD